MLRIKPEVDLQELTKPPFFFQDWEGFYLSECDYATIYVNKDTGEIIIRANDSEISDVFVDDCVEVILDLFQAGLLEKLEKYPYYTYVLKPTVDLNMLENFGYQFTHEYDSVIMIKKTNRGNIFVYNNRKLLTFNSKLIDDLIQAGLVEKE